MSEDLIYITPSDVKDFLYCPYIMYLKKVLGVDEPLTELIKEGREAYELQRQRSKRRKTLLGLKKIKPDNIWFSVKLYSKKYRIYGVADAIYKEGGKYSILEIKYGEYRGRLSKDHFYQAMSYAMMFEEEYYKPVYKITVYYLKDNIMVSRRITQYHKKHWLNIIKDIWNIVDGVYIPSPIDMGGKCRVCFYKKYCYK